MQKINIIEDYLESVLIIQKANGLVRSIDIAHRLGVTKPTVCEMVRKLSDQNMIVFGEDKLIYLTEKGKDIAQKVYNRRLLIEAFLLRIGVSHENAVNEAGVIEHNIGEETYNCLEKLYKSSNFVTYKCN